MEDPVYAVLVVGGCEDVRDNELPCSRDRDAIVAEISVLEQDTAILLVNADSVLDCGRCAGAVDECSIHVVDGSLAVASQA